MQLLDTALTAIKEKGKTIQTIRGLTMLLIVLTITIRHFNLTTLLATIQDYLNLPLLESILRLLIYGFAFSIYAFFPIYMLIIILLSITEGKERIFSEKIYSITYILEVLEEKSDSLLITMTDVVAFAMAGLSFLDFDCFLHTINALWEWARTIPALCQVYSLIAICLLLLVWIISFFPLNEMRR